MQSTKKTVLVVDDDDALRHLLSHVIGHAGYHVVLAENGQVALNYLDAQPLPAVIVLDLRMPVMTGWEFMIAQSQRPHLTGIPIIVYSTETESPLGFIDPRNLFESVNKLEPSRLPKVIERALGDFPLLTIAGAGVKTPSPEFVDIYTQVPSP